MAKKIKSKKKAVAAPKEQTTIPLTGAGVEELRIPALDEALDALQEHTEALDAAKEAVDDAKKVAVDLMQEHKDELVQEDKGGYSYAWNSRLWKLAPTGVKLTMKVIHDKNLGPADE